MQMKHTEALMMKKSTLRIMIDSAMTLISLMLIGGNYFFPWAGVHEILGVSLFVFWGMHVALNRRWYASLLKGSYRPFRIMQTIVNCGILVCAAFLTISGIMLSQHVFVFFLDMEKGDVIFFTDYSAIIVLFAACAHYGAKLTGKKK